MEKVNGYWVDENNNGWNANIYTEEQAKEYSDTLVNCDDCRDCRDCDYCCRCRNCQDCEYCCRCRNCQNCEYCHDCRRCDDCRDCRDCDDCRNCRNCDYCQDIHDYAKTPQRYTTPKIGSRNDSTKVYWTNKNDIQVVCGCFKGDLEDWEEAINETHKYNDKYRNDYLKEVYLVKMLMNLNTGE